MSIVKNRDGETFDSPQMAMVVITCCTCGMPFGVPETWRDKRLEAGKEGRFWCPNGHSLSYRRSEADRLRRELQQAKANESYYKNRAESEQREAQYLKRSRDAYRGQVTKIKRRVSNGVCPCCNRTFQNLARHMEAKHPEWKEVAE